MRLVTIRPPGDKSISHRALFVAALAKGTSEISRILTSEDVKSTARVLRQLGVAVSPLAPGRTVRVWGRGTRLRRPDTTLHCGNSGTTARLAMGLLAAQPFSARLTGDASLRRRPMRRITEPLERMGASFPQGDGRLPLVVRGGRLYPIDFRSAVASAQVKSAVILAGLAGAVPVRLREPAPSRDHTERLLQALGLDVGRDREGILVEPGEVPPFQVSVPSDASSAAFLVAAALLSSDLHLTLEGVGVNPTRTGFLSVLRRMGASIEIVNRRAERGEPVADLVVAPGRLHGTTVRASEVPSLVDEVPVLAVLAALAQGRTVFHDVGELRVKESDRLGLLARNLAAVGFEAAVNGDALMVQGMPDRIPTGAVDTASDHRLTMAFAVLGTLPGARVRLSERRSVSVSYPAFFRDLARVTGDARHRD